MSTETLQAIKIIIGLIRRKPKRGEKENLE